MRSGGRCWGITRWKFRISSFFFFIASEIWWDIDIDVDKNLSIRLLILFSQAIDDFLSILFSDQIIRIDQKFIERFLNFNMAILLHFKYNYHFLSSILDRSQSKFYYLFSFFLKIFNFDDLNEFQRIDPLFQRIHLVKLTWEIEVVDLSADPLSLYKVNGIRGQWSQRNCNSILDFFISFIDDLLEMATGKERKVEFEPNSQSMTLHNLEKNLFFLFFFLEEFLKHFWEE